MSTQWVKFGEDVVKRILQRLAVQSSGGIHVLQPLRLATGRQEPSEVKSAMNG